jgi:hypothetical protein
MTQPIIQPPMITYNLKDRERKFRGQDRNFNIQALCDSINGPATQERVRTRAMVGYFGHKPRILLDSLEPAESVVIKGVYNEIEPAIVTTYLEAFPDGTIKHQTEFLDSVPGRRASCMHSNRIGGFSSAIDNRSNELFGFDYVLDPNFSSNRGYSLDSASLTLDEVQVAIRDELEEFWLSLLEAKDRQIQTISMSLDSLSVENEQLLSILSSKQADMALDSTAIKPLTVSLDSANRMKNDRDLFRRTANLPTFVEPSKQTKESLEDYKELKSRMGF